MATKARRRRKQGKVGQRPTIRRCGGCSACCYAMSVPELELGDFIACGFQTPVGCAIYSRRPQQCRQYQCLWSRGLEIQGIPKALLRPDRLGMIVAHNGKHIVCLETFDGSLRRPLARQVLAFLIGQQAIVVMTKGGNKLIGPRKQVEKLVTV